MSVGGRRSQQERTAQTRMRLLRATIALIHDKGLAHTSTNDVAAAAGVSRGALTHHFESRESLIADAVAQMLEEATREIESFARDFSVGEGSSDEIIDFLWRLMSARLFHVTLEFLPEARHNDLFRARLVPLVAAWHAALDDIWTRLAQRSGVDADYARALMNGTMCVIRGMIAQTILRDDPPYYARLIAFWKDSVRVQLAAAPPAARPRALAQARR